MNELSIQSEIKSRIYTIRNKEVMLDEDLAKLYEVDTKVFNQAVKRNIERFPDDFHFQLTENEYESLRSQFVTSSFHTLFSSIENENHQEIFQYSV